MALGFSAVMGTLGAGAAAGAAKVGLFAKIWAGIKAGATTVGAFLIRNSKKVGIGVAVASTALTGGSYSNGDMSVSYNKGLLDKGKSDSSVQYKSSSKNSNSPYNQTRKKSWSHSATYKKHR